MRFFPVSLLVLLAILSTPVRAQDLQWRSTRQTTSDTTVAAPRRAARFQRSSIEERAKRPTPSAPALVEPVDAKPILQVAHNRPAPRPASPNTRVVKRVAQAETRETLPAPPADSPTISAMPYGEYEEYMEGSPEVTFEGGPEFCGPECGCGFPEPGCEFIEPGCGFGDCCCGEVGCPGDCCDECGCGDECGCCDTCALPWIFGSCAKRGAVPICIYLPPIKEFTAFGGVHGFKGPLDQYRDRGNFGFHEGFNLGGKMAWLPWPGLAYQVGWQATHSQLHGSSENPNYADSHTQHFVTAGLFRRSPVGFQYGVVYDMMRDERITSTSFHQVRGLVSMTNCHGNEVGFMFAVSDDQQDLTGQVAAAPVTRAYEPVDQYLGFWRFHSCSGGEFMLLGGGGSGFGVLGGEINAPLNNWWSLNTGFRYYIPGGSGAFEAQEEGWNLGINLVWHWGGRAKCAFKSPWRPMFNVADNGSFFVDDVD